MNLEEKIEKLREKVEPIFGKEVSLYSPNNSIQDICFYIACDKVDIHYSDIFDWAEDNFDIIDNYMKNCGIGESPKITEIIQGAQSDYYKQRLIDNKEDVLKYNAYNYLRNNDIEIDEDDLESLDEFISDFDIDDSLSELHHYCDKFKATVR